MEYFFDIDINLDDTFNCGQCFRWVKCENGSYSGVAGGKKAIVRESGHGMLISGINGCDLNFWEDYFCVDEDYPALLEKFSEDRVLKAAVEFAPGIRVLRQERFETLISFIISQNNNIKRITGIINRLCGETPDCAFPSPSVLANMNESDFTAMGAGYRARYILDAANKVNSGEIRLDEIAEMPYNIAKGELLKIVGVGEKVADCVLLYGFHMTEAYPRDVWIKRVIAEYYPDRQALPECTKGFEGIAQQFLFHYIRKRQ